MTERHSQALRYFVAPAAKEEGDGTAERPFTSLRQAWESLRDGRTTAVSDNGAPEGRTIEIVLAAREGNSK